MSSHEWMGKLTEVSDLARLAKTAETLFGPHAKLTLLNGHLLRISEVATGKSLALIEFEPSDEECSAGSWSIQPIREGEDGAGEQ